MGYWQQLKQCNYFKNVLNFLVRKKVLTRKSSTRFGQWNGGRSGHHQLERHVPA